MEKADSTGQYTILFADISGSTALYEKIGDTAALAHIGTSLTKIATVVATHGGTVVKTMGDELMCYFTDPAEAIAASCNIHEMMENQTDLHAGPLSVRIGFHTGPALLKDNDLYGDAVNVAARVVALAKSKQTLTTAQTVGVLPKDQISMTRLLNEANVKGKQETLVLHEVIWQAENLTVLRQSRMISAKTYERLVLNYRGIIRTVDSSTPSFSIGRELDCHLQIASPLASRLHAKLEYRQGRFVLADHSANGTYVSLPDIDNLCLRREPLPLFGAGIISCGEKIREDGAHLIRFACE